MSYLINLLKSPSGFSKDPWRFLWNQVGHAVAVGYVLTWFGVPFWLLFLGYGLWEFTQWVSYEAEAWDCFEDMVHVMLASLTIQHQLLTLAVVQSLLLAGGFLRRKSDVVT